VPVGRPLAGARAHILDGDLRPVPVGVLGELFLGGTGVARGYLGRPDLTAERFLPDPFAAVAPMSPMPGGDRLYRSGDLARRRADGSLELAGRVDAQVKIRGFRVEPGEIESVLAASPEVAECAVVAREVGDTRSLVAYVVAPTGAKVSVADLRAFLEARLPAFMMPAAFVALPALPRTVTGKIDRRSLPAPGGSGVETARAYVAPRTDVEEIIAGIWREALGLERLSVHDGFFELGGHSLLLLQVMRRLREAFDLEVPLRTIYEERTVEALALKVEELLLHEISREP
jgi:acyl carrier protein